MDDYEFWTAIVALVALFAGVMYIIYDIFQYLDGAFGLPTLGMHVLIILFMEFICLEICGFYLNKRDNSE